ncbi:class IIb bacteriocin, lactobin A/cerein 7B family [Hymenobacter lutimineralis]|uniref:Class IIb bacteriocin, lactobin A/cerein 7B family n=1 Tax=Hymenobacter lutimineralis TaxID=2606448 RepID=A0A5D6V8A9_9BACT|nr:MULTISPECIES: class IIb bacteriocin, lactobin A/cerein 7B family [Hymenobacter]QIX59660.1 class IIb bacteriocin, lactobin A/cerein 7B family [Hymenobacter sp. BT18]TYZ10894.1 class IIb bacteriocin, lactobin A/cerein 7B family [Hymenobacter lutimineralis]
MNAQLLKLDEFNLVELSHDENAEIEGGFLVQFLAIGAAMAAGVAIYEAGKYTGEFIYHVTH